MERTGRIQSNRAFEAGTGTRGGSGGGWCRGGDGWGDEGRLRRHRTQGGRGGEEERRRGADEREGTERVLSMYYITALGFIFLAI